MTQYSFPWNDVNGDRLYDADDFMRFFAAFMKTGVVMSFMDGLRVQSAKNGMNIQVGGGSAVINGSSFLNDGGIGFQVNVASSIQDRTDSVVLRMDRNARNTQFVYKPGDTIIARNDTVFELQLAKISVKMNATQITDADITDMRSDPTVCGWCTPFDNINVDGIVGQYKGIFEQADLKFQDWFQNLQNQLNTNQATNLQSQINTLISTKAADDKVVHLDGDETITGKKTFTDKAAFTDITVSKIESLDDTDIATINATNAPSAKVHYMRQNGIVYVTAAGNWGTFEKGKGLAKATLPAGFRPPVEWGAGIGPMGGNSGLTASIGTNGVLTISSSEAGTEYGAFSMSYPAAN